ncbi:MAG TPA: glycosyltransferase [Thermomicrobiales bacterium]|nr:glycosyltransferase [Thermomicrobiales bacterium]
MKLLFLHRFRNFAGAERQLVELARGLSAIGHDITVVTFYTSERVEQMLRPAGVRVISLNKSGRWDLPRFGLRLIRTLHEERVDLVHGYLGFANAALTLTKPIHRAKVVWGVRSSDIDIARYDRLSRLDAWIESVLSRYPDLIISNSASGRQCAIDRGFPPEKMIVIPNGVDLVRFQRDEAARLQVRADWGAAMQHRVIGRVGRIDPQKDFETFLRAAALLTPEHPDLRFAIIASDPHGRWTELQAFATSLGLGDALIWNHAREDMAAVYSALDLNVSSSAYGEGIPNVLVEAMTCGTPCVTTDVGDSAATIADLGPVVARADPAALASAMLKALGNPPSASRLRAHATGAFAMEHLVQRSEAAFSAVCAGTRPTMTLEQAG